MAIGKGGHGNAYIATGHEECGAFRFARIDQGQLQFVYYGQ